MNNEKEEVTTEEALGLIQRAQAGDEKAVWRLADYEDWEDLVEKLEGGDLGETLHEIIFNAVSREDDDAFAGIALLNACLYGTSIFESADFLYKYSHRIKSFVKKSLGDTLTIPDGVEVVTREMVKDPLRLRKVILSPSVRRIDDKAFSNCTMLGDVVFSAGLKEIGKEAFAECDYLCLEELPDGLEKIEDRAFFDCSNFFASPDCLDRFPDSMLELGSEIFENCEDECGIEDFTIPANVKKIGKCVFGAVSISGTLTIEGCPEGIDSGRLSSYSIGAICAPAETLERLGYSDGDEDDEGTTYCLIDSE